MSHRTAASVVAACFLGLAGVSLGCGGSPPSSPSLPTTPPAPAAPPAPPVLTLTSVSPTAGPLSGLDVIRVTGLGFQPGASVLVDDIAARTISVTPTRIVAETPPHALGPVELVVKNPDGQSARLAGAYRFAAGFTVTASASAIAPGAELSVSWDAPSGRDCDGGGDWIAIYPVGAPDDTGASNGHSDLWYEHLCGATAGRFTLRAPARTGEYEFRYMVGGTSVARSGSVTIA